MYLLKHLPSQEWHLSSMSKAGDLLTQLLFGLEDALREALEALVKSMEGQYERTRDLNVKKIQLRCTEVQKKVEVSAIVVTIFESLYNQSYTDCSI